MSRDTLHFDVESMWRALELIDPVSALAGELALDAPHAPALRLWPDLAGDLALVDEPGTDRSCALPVGPLQMLSIAARSAFAARQLLSRSVVTAGVLSSGLAAQLMLAVIAQFGPCISHVTFHADGGSEEIEPRLIDQLDLAGVSFVVARSVTDAVRGANLVIAYGHTPPELRIDQLSPRCVLVNAVGADLPDDLVDGVGGIYVDDARLLDANQHRYFVQPQPLTRRSGYRRGRRLPIVPSQGTRVLGDFHDLLHHQKRPAHLNDVVLVELLGTDVLDAAVAGQLHHAARQYGFGVPAGNPELFSAEPDRAV